MLKHVARVNKRFAVVNVERVFVRFERLNGLAEPGLIPFPGDLFCAHS